MDPITQKIKQWIDEGRDPRSAHWQGGLEAIMNVFLPYMEPGNLIPVQQLEDDDLPVYKAALAVVDLSPTLNAVFIPPAIAGQIIPPESATELLRIDQGKPSYKVLITRPGEETRILCAELSAHAKNPGVDILQSGALLGTYDYETHQECLENLTKTIRAHVWEKHDWSQDDYKKYTLNWFEKVMFLGSGAVGVEESCSYLHSPTLIQANKVDALFTLITEAFLNRHNDADEGFKAVRASIESTPDPDLRGAKATEFVERSLLEFLNVIREEELVKFDEFSNKETEEFKTEFSRTIRRLVDKLFN